MIPNEFLGFMIHQEFLGLLIPKETGVFMISMEFLGPIGCAHLSTYMKHVNLLNPNLHDSWQCNARFQEQRKNHHKKPHRSNAN